MCIIKKSVEHSFFVHNDEKKIYVIVFVKKVYYLTIIMRKVADKCDVCVSKNRV